MRANRVELEDLPTDGSWSNWIEAEFAALRFVALAGTDHRVHTEQDAAIAACLRWRTHPSHAEGQRRDRHTHPHLDPLPGQGGVTYHKVSTSWTMALMSTGLPRERRTQAGLLAAVDAGELPAGPAYRHRNEGAIAVGRCSESA